MGDSTEMTIEFLRARLLSERSVSRTAKQRADQLSKRVLELEEQLRIITIQRKKAEKAAAEVLSILETQGICELSEATDYSSDQDESTGKGCDDSLKEYQSSTASRMERSEVDDGLSGSEPEVSRSNSRSLSWKSHSNTPDSRDKQKAKQVRQRQKRRSFMSTLQSSPKHHSGKSCRKIKSRHTGSAEDSQTDKPTILDQAEVSMEASRGMMVEDTSVLHYVDNHNNESEGHPDAKESGRDEEMERALEQQAKLIGQFQAEENAQREWEKNYNENKVNYEPGNQPFVTENSGQSKKEATDHANRIPDYNEKAEVRAAQISNTEEPESESPSSSGTNNRSNDTSNVAFAIGFMPSNLNPALNGNNSNVAVNESKNISQEFVFLSPERSDIIKNQNQNEIIFRDDSSNGYSSNLSVHQVPSSSLGNVLEALKHAKLSLSQELIKLPSQSQGTLAMSTQIPNSRTRGLDIPVGSASLFRLPTDSFPTSQLSRPTLNGSGLSLPAAPPDVGYATSLYGYRNSNTIFEEARSRVLTGNEFLDDRIRSNVPNFSMYARTYSDMSSAERAPSLREFSKSYSDARNGNTMYNVYRGDHTM